MAFIKKKNHVVRKKKVCPFSKEELDKIDYKDIPKLLKLTSDRGKILPRRVTGVCAAHQRKVAKAIKKARVLGLLPYVKD